MASSSMEPALWAEKLQLILPSSTGDIKADNGPATLHSPIPLREAAPLLANALCASQETQRFAILVTAAPKVGAFVALLRKLSSEACGRKHQQQLLIGSFSEHQWLVPVLDVIVATPEEALHAGFSSSALQALLVDVSCPGIIIPSFKLAARFTGFKPYMSYLDLPPPISWYARPRLVPASPAILEILPGSSPLTWDASTYISALTTFAWGVSKVAIQNYYDIPAFLPGIIRGAVARTAPALVVAPREKLEQIAKLLHTAAAQLGVSKLSVGGRDGVDIVLDCPEELSIPQYLERLVVVEADRLLDSEAAWKIQLLAKMCLNCPIGLQFSHRTAAVEEFLKNSKRFFYELSPPTVTLERVYHFSSLVDSNSDKLGRVCRVWRQLLSKSSTLKVAIFCNLADTVVWLANQMRKQGFEAWSLCEGDGEVDPEMYKAGFPVLVTNSYRRTILSDVINFDLPSSLEEYVERVGHDRATTTARRKLVINIVTAEEERRVFGSEGLPLMTKLPDDCSGLHRRLHSFFPQEFK